MRGLSSRAGAAVRAILTETATPGASVAIRIAGRPPWLGAIGSRDPAGSAPLTPEDRFYIYSVTKLLLTAAALRLATRGTLALDAPIANFLPELALPAPITLCQLLGHTAGLPDYGRLPAYNDAIRATPEEAWSDDTFLAQTLSRDLLFPPGEGWAYSNIGYLLVRRIVERATGEAWGAILDRELFAPLGLRRTSVVATLNDAAALTPGWSQFLDPAGELANITPRYHPGWVAHGVVGSTAGEVAALVEAIVAGSLLADTERTALLAPRALPFTDRWFRQPAYGLGVMLDPASPYGLVAGHGGGGPGYAAGAFYFADLAGQPTTIVALLNRDHGDAALRIVFALADLLAAGDQL